VPCQQGWTDGAPDPLNRDPAALKVGDSGTDGEVAGVKHPAFSRLEQEPIYVPVCSYRASIFIVKTPPSCRSRSTAGFGVGFVKNDCARPNGGLLQSTPGAKPEVVAKPEPCQSNPDDRPDAVPPRDSRPEIQTEPAREPEKREVSIRRLG
jgi:hypothetical protein